MCMDTSVRPYNLKGMSLMTSATILAVEDENIVAKDIQDSLERLGYTVEVALSGEEALDKANRTRPDLVLMDIALKAGGIDGIEAAELIRGTLDIPVVYLTAYGDDLTLERAQRTEPMGYILKPFETRELQSAIKIALYKDRVDRKLRTAQRHLAAIL